ncbi:phosphoribosylanthranilate isomerase [Sinomicrobium sp. FJxs]|uniref:N-(5'-phosphoribosyl)anthranilate isomerase n=2 Tax=Sinomicrobium weinanense TaxID=2842200 RepID=A0A926JSL7_9FLAO|nr:phosphoribosylanthranilate isomerase [Sinomicrobium weinanense]MBU3123534.1 phosphoribosylanthranilate isomerase [Sinomicrobium weinanense]
MKYPDNMLAVAALQPDYMGFIFYDRSPRYFEGEMPKLPGIKKTGVFVKAPVNDILVKVRQHHLQAVQLHGGESAEFCRELALALSGDTFQSKVELIKVFSMLDTFDFEQLKPFEDTADYFLFDTKGKLPGGNGYTFDWRVLKNYPSKKPFFLSGGIGPEEADKVLAFLENQPDNRGTDYCYAIDVNSRFEIEPGLKNTEKLKEFKSKISCQHQ